MHRTIKSRPHHLRHAAGIIAVGLVDLRQRTVEPLRLWSGFQANPLEVVGAALVPSLKSAGDICHTLAVLPALPELCPLLRRKPCPCMHTHRSPPTPTRLEGVAVTG